MTTAPPPAKPAAPPPRKGPPPGATTSAPTVGRLTPRKVMKPTPRLLIAGVEGFGKSTIGAYAPDPFILMSAGETGYDTLLSAGRVPQCPAEVCDDFAHTLAWLDSIIADPQGRKSIVLDVGGGFDKQAQAHACRMYFKSDWHNPRDGFLSYGADKGYKATALEWGKVLSRLDQLVIKHGIIPIILCHVRKDNFKNPMGPDFDVFSPDMSKYVLADTVRWSDATLFGKFYTVIDAENRGKGKGIGGTDRIVYTEARDAFVAKNRYGMPAEISLNVEPSEMWNALWQHIAPGA